MYRYNLGTSPEARRVTTTQYSTVHYSTPNLDIESAGVASRMKRDYNTNLSGCRSRARCPQKTLQSLENASNILGLAQRTAILVARKYITMVMSYEIPCELSTHEVNLRTHCKVESQESRCEEVRYNGHVVTRSHVSSERMT